MVNSAVKPDLKSNTFCISKNYSRLKEKEIHLIDFKFYQKLFVVLISLSTFLIFPEKPKEIENICESYNSRESCNIW